MDAPKDKNELWNAVHSRLLAAGLSHCTTYRTRTTKRLRYSARDKDGFRITMELDPMDTGTDADTRHWYLGVFTTRGRVRDLNAIRDALAKAGMPVTIARTRWRKSRRVYILWGIDEHDNVDAEAHEST